MIKTLLACAAFALGVAATPATAATATLVTAERMLDVTTGRYVDKPAILSSQ